MAWGKAEKEVFWRVYAWRTCAFGDVGASCLLYNVIKKAAGMFTRSDVVRRQLVDNCYVDDITSMGQTAEQRDEVEQGIDEVLQQAGLPHCPWTKIEHPPNEVPAGPPTKDELLMMKKIFGHVYLPSRDSFTLKPVINLHNFKRGRPCGPPLEVGQDVKLYVSGFQITKRLLARVAMSIFDLTAYLILPQMVNRLYFHRALVYEETVCGWDSVVSEEMRLEFVRNIEMIMSLDGFTWPRCAIPSRGYKVTKNSPMLVYPSDGSGSASVSYAYLVVERKDDDPEKSQQQPNHVSLIKAMGKICSAGSDSVPRLELTSIVMSCKITEVLKNQLPINVSRSLYLSDSSTCILQCNSRTALYNSWVLPRLRYIKQTINVEEDLMKLPSEQNGSDLGSKMLSNVRVNMESEKYRYGCFMRSPVEEWPISFLPRPKTMQNLPEVQRKFQYFSNNIKTEISGSRSEERIAAKDSCTLSGSRSEERIAAKDSCTLSGSRFEEEIVAEDTFSFSDIGENDEIEDSFLATGYELSVLEVARPGSLVNILQCEVETEDDKPIFFNPVEDFFEQATGMEDLKSCNVNKLFSNPLKKHSKRAPRIKREEKFYNKNIEALFTPSHIKNYESEEENCEYFGNSLWKYKVYLGIKKKGSPGGEFEERYGDFFSRRRDFTKTLTAIGWALRWRKKYRLWPMQELRNHVTTVLAKMATPRTFLMLQKINLRDSCQFIKDTWYVQHRKILESSYPEYSLLLPPSSHMAKAMATSLHEKHHLLDSRSFSSILKRGDTPVHIPRLNPLLRQLEEDCVTCKIRLSCPSFAKEGALPRLKVKPISHFSSCIMDLTGPIWLQENGRNKKKVWLGILVSKNTGLLYLDTLQDYSAKALDTFLSTMEYELCVKLRKLEADSGSNFISLRKNTKNEALGRSRSETSRKKEEMESENVEEESHFMEKFVREMRLTSARRGYLLKIAPPHAHHQIGSCEKIVHLLKCYFRDLPPEKNLNIWSLRYILKKFSFLHNSRPVCVQGKAATYLTRAHLLSGRSVPYFRENERLEEEEEVSSRRRWKDDAEEVESQFYDLFQQYLLLKEEYYLRINKNKFNANSVPEIGDLVHVRSFPRCINFSLGIIVAVEHSDDGEQRTFWLKIVRPAVSSHPFPLHEKTQEPEIFHRDIRDLVLLMRKKELGIDLTKDATEIDDEVRDDVEGLGDETNEDPDDLEYPVGNDLDDQNDVEHSEGKSPEKEKNGIKFFKNKRVSGSTFVDQILHGKNVVDKGDVLEDVVEGGTNVSFSKRVPGMLSDKDASGPEDEEANPLDDHKDTSEPENEEVDVLEDGSDYGDIDSVYHANDDEGSSQKGVSNSNNSEELGRGRRPRPKKGFFKNMSIWMLLFCILQPGEAMIKINPRNMCDIEYDQISVDEAVGELEHSIEIWKNQTTPCFPEQIGLINQLPVYRVESQTLLGAREMCGQKNSEMLTIESLQEYEQLLFILKQKGIYGFLVNLVIKHDAISFWPGEKDFKNWMSKEDLEENIEKVLPKSYIGEPINKEAIFIYEDVTEAKRKCRKLGGSLVQFDDLEEFEAINKLATKTNLSTYSIWLDYHERSKSLNWPSGDIFHFSTLEKTISLNKESEERFKGYVTVNLELATPRLVVRDSYGNVPFLCVLPHLVEQELFYLSLLEFGDPTYCVEKMFEPFGSETPILCLQ